LAWRPNGRALAVGTQDGFLQVWRQATTDVENDHARQLTMRGYPSKVNCLAWHPYRGTIATAGGPDVVLWELPEAGKGARAQPLRHHQNTVTTLSWSADGQLLASGDRSGRLCVWDRDGDAVFSRQLTHEISALQWQPCGDTLAAGDTGGGLHLLGRNQLPSEPYTL
jgi:WD40 repeat protein